MLKKIKDSQRKDSLFISSILKLTVEEKLKKTTKNRLKNDQ